MSSKNFVPRQILCESNRRKYSQMCSMSFTWTSEKKKIEDVLLLPEKENKIFKVSKCEGNCVKGLVTNTEPFRLREIQINFFKCSYKVDASFKTYI